MAVDEDLVTMRDRLTERFAVMQSELGGAFYEMAIRDHVRIEVLMRRAADLQRVDSELGQVERLLAEGAVAAAGHCPACGAVHARGAAFCAQCAQPLLGT
jgi:alkylhydroperoxidase/carboxymuconolactone decarboxylase family protein YurZ